MFPFLTIFLIIVIALNIALRRQGKSVEDAERRFWERELAANHVRKKDIRGLDYINIPLEKIPQNLHTDAENELVALASEKLLNLSGLTNTDLKLKYGVGNLDTLSTYDANFLRFAAAVPVYAGELIAAGQTDDARALLEFAVDTRADSSKIFTLLARLYQESGEQDKIEGLLAIARSFDTISGRMTVTALEALL